jgi:hypothetical protein
VGLARATTTTRTTRTTTTGFGASPTSRMAAIRCGWPAMLRVARRRNACRADAGRGRAVCTGQTDRDGAACPWPVGDVQSLTGQIQNGPAAGGRRGNLSRRRSRQGHPFNLSLRGALLATKQSPRLRWGLLGHQNGTAHCALLMTLVEIASSLSLLAMTNVVWSKRGAPAPWATRNDNFPASAGHLSPSVFAPPVDV